MAHVDFSDLPAEVLDNIARRAGPLDNVVCSMVCKPWRRALKTARLRLLKRPHRPHKVELSRFYYYEQRNTVKVSSLNWDGATVETAVVSHSGGEAPTRPTRIIGCSHGWLVTVDEACGLFLLDPFTGRLFPLPPITTSRSKKVAKDVDQMGHEGMFQKAVLVPGRRLGSYAVMLIHSGGFGLSFLRPGARSWTTLRVPKWMAHRYMDAAYHKGAFYTVGRDAEVNAWVVDGSSSGLRARSVTGARKEKTWAALVESLGGDHLLMVSTALDVDGGLGRSYTRRYDVSRYDDESDDGGWRPVEDLGEAAILVGISCSMCVSTRGSRDASRNRIYFAQPSYGESRGGFYGQGHPWEYKLPTATRPTGHDYLSVPYSGASWFQPYVDCT